MYSAAKQTVKLAAVFLILTAATLHSQEPTAKPATVYFYHVRDTPGGWWVHPVVNHPYISVDSVYVQTIMGAQYFMIEVPAGHHILSASRGRTTESGIDLEPGKTYYIRISNHAMAVKVPWTFDPVTQEQAEREMIGSKQTFAKFTAP
jgi:hypothetical protein